MNDLKRISKQLNLIHYSEQIVENINKADKVTKYLLFTHVTNYMGMSLPTSVILFFTTNYVLSKTKINIEEEEEPKEEKLSESGILEYLFFRR